MATEWNWEALPKSLAVYLWNSGSCNGCDSEFFALSGPRYDLERLGIQRVDSPYHADVLVVSGPVIASEVGMLRQIHSQMADPKIVIAIGACAVSGGIFRSSRCLAGPLDAVLPVDVYVQGCPPRPEALIEGFTRAVIDLEGRRKLLEGRSLS